ncbi:hypothetical protein B0H13DRAFT_2449257, partial [Mycena leptocephala]
MHNPRNNLAIQFSVLSFSLLEHSARGVASHLEVFAIYVTARFYLSLLILCSITAFWSNILGKRAWVMPVTGEEWSLNIKVWVNVLGGHSTVHRRGRDERHPSHVTRSPTNPLSEFAISLADYGPIDEELKRALPREWRCRSDGAIAHYAPTPLGWIPPDLHKLLFNRSRLRIRTICTATLLIVVLSLTSISFILSQPPIEYVAVQQMGIDTPNPPPVIPPPVLARPGPKVGAPVTELLGTLVYHPFVHPSPPGYLVNQIVRPIRRGAGRCGWVPEGRPDAIVDLVYVWVNGSDPLHVKARAELLAATNYTTTEARFREHDELRYSLRAARLATESWPHTRWHVITADVPHPNPNNTDHGWRLGLVPQWLDIQCAFHSPDHHPSIHLHHDTEIFRLTGRPGSSLTSADAIDWLGKVIPSFNRFSANVADVSLSVALNDDQFLMMPIPPSAFHSTLYGPVFRIQPHLLVGGDASGDADGNGEWRSLGWSSHLMSQRFGLRKRPYTQHNARALSVPLMHEMSLTFGSYFAATPFSQFRGSHNAPEELEVNTIFMATHFVIERHREALLWSWIVGKWGGQRGVLGRDQKKRMWRELGGREGDTLNLLKATRSTMEDLELN